jgi:hypothetical protein
MLSVSRAGCFAMIVFRPVSTTLHELLLVFVTITASGLAASSREPA